MPDSSSVRSEFDQVNVRVLLEKLGYFYIDMLIAENGRYFINIEDLFRTLMIHCEVGQKGDSIGGVIGVDQRRYQIDFRQKIITSGTKSYKAVEGLIKESGFVFIESSLLPEAFGLLMTYNPKSLSSVLKASFELPVVKLMRIEKIRQSLNRLKGQFNADTTLGRCTHFFKGGTFDWQVGCNQIPGWQSDVRIQLLAGAELLWGEAEIELDYYNHQPLTNNQLHYIWRWVDNDRRIIRQAQIGTIQTPHIAFYNYNLLGGTIRNTPSTVRKATGFFTIQETTEPDWIVELYVNDVLVDFTKADVSGKYLFKVPLVYGFTSMKLKFYGPLGEERTEERTLNLPYSFLPVREFEYSLTGGVLQNAASDRFARADINYGLFRTLTVGAGTEYLSSLGIRPFIPFLKFSFQPYPKLRINGEYAHGVKVTGMASLFFMKSVNLELEYNHYWKDQKAIPFKPLEEWNAGISVPYRIKKTSGYFRGTFFHQRFLGFDNTQSNVMLSWCFWRFSANSSTQVTWQGGSSAYVLTNLSFLYRFNRQFSARVMSQYAFRNSQFITLRSELEKRWKNGTINLTYELGFQYNSHSVNLTCRYDLPFSRINASVARNNDTWVLSQGAQGGTAFGSGNRYVYASYNAQAGTGGISLYPFLDLNHNGRFDPGEKMIRLNSLKIMNSKILFIEKDSVIRLPNLIPFTSYVVEFSDNDLDNIAWRFAQKTYAILIDPNQFKKVDIPVIPVGEINGTAYVERNGVLHGTGRLLVNIYCGGSSEPFAQVLTESDGYLNFFGLPPGSYTASIDQQQLGKMGYTAEPIRQHFTIRQVEEGDIVDGIDFILKEK